MKKVISLILALVMILPLCACGSSESENNDYPAYDYNRFVGAYGANVDGEFKSYPICLTIKSDGTATYWESGGSYSGKGNSVIKDIDAYSLDWHPDYGYDRIAISGYITYSSRTILEGKISEEQKWYEGYCYLEENDTIISFMGEKLGRIPDKTDL